MKMSIFSFIGLFFLVGSIVNDVSVFERDGSVTWAKVMFFLGAIFLLINGLSIRAPRKVEFLVYMYVVALITLSIVLGGYGFSSRSFSVALSLLMGAMAFSVVVRSNIGAPVISKIYMYWIVVSIIIGCFQSLFGVMFFTDRIFDSTTIPGLYRASGLMSDPNYFALICLIALPLVKFSSNANYVRFFIYLGVLLSGSRAGILVLFGAIAIGFILGKDKKGGTIRFYVFLLLSFITVAFLLNYLPNELLIVFDPGAYGEEAERNSLQDRSMAIAAGVRAFIDNPISGYGLGNLINHPINIRQMVSHNTYIELLAENGLIGLFFYLTVVYAALKKTSPKKNKFGDLHYSDTGLALVLVFSAMSMALVTYYSRIFFFTLALSVLLSKSHKVTHCEGDDI